jgi:hypothetical protein
MKFKKFMGKTPTVNHKKREPKKVKDIDKKRVAD